MSRPPTRATGEHAPIVDEDLWRQVQEKLQANGVERRGARDEAKLAYLLPGVLFDAEGRLMTPTHAIKKGVHYRYYVSRRLITEVRGGDKHDPGAGQRLPAVKLERLIVERLKIFFADADAIAGALSPAVRSAPNLKRAFAAASDIVRAIETEGEMRTFGLLRPLIVRPRRAGERGSALRGAIDATELPCARHRDGDLQRPSAGRPDGEQADSRHPPSARVGRSAKGLGLRLSRPSIETAIP